MKEVLVLYDVYSRVVRTRGDLGSLEEDIWAAFSDVLPPRGGSNIVLKKRDEKWGGMFVELSSEDDVLPEKCVIQVHSVEKVSSC